MITVEILNSYFIIEGPKEVIDKIQKEFSFKSKAAEYDLVRFIKGQQAKRKFQTEEPEWYGPWFKQKIAELKSKVLVYACKRDENTLMVPNGLLERSGEISELRDIVYQDLRNFDLNKRHLSKPRITLRKPQIEALDALGDKTHGLFRIATGVGKTALGIELIYRLGHRTLFLAPSISIVDQTVKRFKEVFGDKYVGEFSGKKKQDKWITVATYQSVAAMEGTFEDVDLVLADECHKIGSDTFFDAVVNKTPNAIFKIGLSAHEERADGGTILVNAGVGEVIYDYPASVAIQDGFLAKPSFIIYDVITTGGTFKKWKTSGNKRVQSGTSFSHEINDKDDGKCYKNWIIGNDKLNKKVVSMAVNFINEGKHVLILFDEKEHIDKIVELLPYSESEYGICVGGDKDNQQTLKRFNNKEIKLLLGTSTLSEGVDTVPVDVLINLQGGASVSKTKQANGRALRNDPDPITGIPRKPTCLIIDFNYPLCDILYRHSKVRELVHSEIGEIIHLPLDT